MSDPKGVFAASREGRTLNEIYGLGLGSSTGQYAWPYAACAGSLTKNGTYLPVHPREAVRLCKIYCGKKRSLTGGSVPSDQFTGISRFPKTTTCEQQCEEIARTYEKTHAETVEGFSFVQAQQQPWYLIPLSFVVTLMVCLFIVKRPLPDIKSPLPIVDIN